MGRRGLTIAVLATVLALAHASLAGGRSTGTGGPGPAGTRVGDRAPAGFPDSATTTATLSRQHRGPVLIGLGPTAQSVTPRKPTGYDTINSRGGQTHSGVTVIPVAAGVSGVQTIDPADVAADGDSGGDSAARPSRCQWSKSCA
jgi:hypothetical protein